MMGRVPTKPGASSASETTGNRVSAWGLLPQLLAQLCALGLPEQTVLIRGSLKLETPLVWSPLPRRAGCREKAGLQSGGSARWGAGCEWGPVRFMCILHGLFCCSAQLWGLSHLCLQTPLQNGA